jgi:hypothetical protein
MNEHAIYEIVGAKRQRYADLSESLPCISYGILAQTIGIRTSKALVSGDY